MPNLLLAFKQFLLNLKLSTVSRKLYLSDTRHFLNWLGSEPTLRELSSAKSYSGYLSHLRSHATAPSMLKRTVASLRQFGDFLSLTYSLPNPMSNLSSTSNLQAANCELRTEQYIKHFTNYLNAEHLSPLTIKSYKSDITRYFDWINTHVASNRIEEVLKGKNIELYLNHLSDSATVLPSTIERKLKSLDRFQVWYANIYSQTHASDNQAIQQNSVLSKFRSFSAPHTELAEAVGEIGTSAIPDMTRFFVKKLNYRTVAFMAILLLFTSTLAIFGYRQFSRDVRLTAAYPSTPVTPGRVLSFQGRLEDENGTPITGPTDITFKLWNHLTDDTEVSCDGGGDENCLYSTDVCSIDPDDDGVFSTQIGASCGTSIDPTVFTENTGVWLEVKVDTETLSPRQPIASVAYALNSETIQGFPISSTVSAIRNTVVPMNEFGEIIVGEQSPRLTGVSGTFQISAPSLSFITTTGTNGSISLAPDGTGQINMYGNTTSTNFLNISNAQLTTGSLITGTVGNDNSGFKLLDFLSGSSPTSVFSVAANGNITTAVGLTIGSTALSSTGNPSGASLIGTFDEFDNSDSTTVQAVLNDLDANLTTALTTDDWSTSLGSIYPNNSTFDLLIGGQASSSAKFAVLNVNSGTPVASVSAGTAGAVYLSAAGSLATTAKQSLTLGSSDTGNIILAPGGVIALTGIAANLTAAGNLDVAGTLFAGTADAFQISATGIITTLTDETINGIDITAGTISDVVNLTINAGGDLTIGTIGLNDIGTDNITSGASLIGTFDEFDNSDSTTIQAVLNDLDAAIGYVSSLNDDWSVGLGSLYPKNSTLDLLVGGQATSSAKFAVLNIDTGTPTASVSAGVAGAAYLTATGNLATTAMQTLTLGGASTGNILLNSGNIGFASSAYLNWGSTYGEGGYGFRDNAGTMEYKNSTGDWAGIGSGSGSGGSNWRIDSGALSPLNDTLDLLVGNIATASAKFAVNASSGDVTLTGDLIGGTGSIINFPNFDVDTSGNVSLADQADLRLLESSGGGTNYTGFQAPATLAANYLYTMPSAFPVSATGYFLTSSDTGTLSWTDTLAASSVLFSGIGSGTNTSAAMVVGTGASLAYTGSGTIAATTLLGGTWAIPGAIGSDTANSGAFTTLAATGDLTFTQTTPRIYFGDSSTDEDDYTINVDASSFNIKNNSDSSRIDLLFSGDGSVEIGNNNNAKTVTIAGGTGADTINIGTGGTSADTINIGGYATTTTNFNGVVNFANGSTYFVDNAGNAKFLDFIAADTGNPGVTIGDGATGFTKIGSATLGDNNTAYFHFDTDSNTSDEIRIYDNGSLWSNTGVLTSGVADGATAIAYTLNTINALSTPGSKLLSLQNQGTEKFYIDANGNLYTSGTILSGNGQGMLMTNKSGGTVAARSLVVLDTTTDSSFTTTTTPYAKTSYGIVTGVGLGVTNDANGNGACDTNDICMVAVGGEIEVKLTNAATAAKGDYVFTGDTAGSGVASAKQFDGLIGMVSNVAGAGSGYVKMIFKVQPQVTAAASIDKGSKHNEYWLYADKYAAVGAGSDTDANLLNRGLTFDTFTDTTKTDSANTTVSGPVQMSADTSRVGLLGGQTMATSTTDNAGNTYLGSNTVNDTYYYDRTKDSSPQVQVELGIDPNWYNGVTLSVATSSAELSQSEVITQPNPNLSTTYNGSLLKVTGTDSSPRPIYITIKSPTTFDWNNYAGDSGTGTTITPGTAQLLTGTGVYVTFTNVSYNVGDVFKIASWFIEGSGATRGSKQQFPERSYVIATASGVSIIDADTQKLWMRFSQHADGYMIGVDTANDPSATQGLNGKVYVSENGASATGLYTLDFIHDSGFRNDATNYSLSNQPIANRNAANSYNANNTSQAIVSTTANDVSAAVIPNQPTQEVTVSGWGYIAMGGINNASENVNLPYKFNNIPEVSVSQIGIMTSGTPSKPTDCSSTGVIRSVSAGGILNNSFTVGTFRTDYPSVEPSNYIHCYSWTATGTVSPKQFVGAATDSGVTVINSTDGTAYSYSDVAADDYNAISLTSGGRMYALNETQAQLEKWRDIASNTASETAGTPDYVWDQASTPALTATAPTIQTYPSNLNVTERTSTINPTNDTIYIGTNLGASVIQTNDNWPTANDGAEESYGSVKYYTKDYISEEMVGDVRGMWPLNADNTASNLEDISVKANNLTATNITSDDAVSGIRGTATDFDGSTEYLTCTDAACGGTSKLDTSTTMSISAWIKPASIGANDLFVGKAGASWFSIGGTNVGCSAGKIGFASYGGSAWGCVDSITTPIANQWYHVLATSDGTSIRLYINGQLESTITKANPPNSTGDFYIGGYGPDMATYAFPGVIDEVEVTATALTSSQIRHMYEVGYRALQSHGTGLGGGAADTNQQLGSASNVIGAVAPDLNNQYLYVGANHTTDGALSKIQLNSDTNIKTYDVGANVPSGGTTIIDDDITSLGVGYNLETVGSAASGVKTMGVDNYATTTSGNYVSKTVTTAESFSQAYIWAQYILDPSDVSNTIVASASNDGGSTYTTCNLTNTDSSQSPTEYEYYCQFNNPGSSLKTKFAFVRGSTKTNSYLTRWGLAWISGDVLGGSTAGNGLYTNSDTAVADGDYLTVSHNQSTIDLVTSAWINAQSTWKLLDGSYKPAIAWEGKDTERGIYHNEVNLYQPSEETNQYTENLLQNGLLFDTFEDSTKTDSANLTASLTNQKGDDGSANRMTLTNRQQAGRTGLLGGQTMATSTTDNAGNTYLGSNTVNDTYYYDRTKDSSPQVQVELGIDPNWYNGVTLSVATTSAELSQSEVITQPNPNLSTTYNGSLLKVTGTDSSPRPIYITIKSPTTFDWNNYAGDSGTGTTITPGTAQLLTGTGVYVTFTNVSYNVGDVFKIASWYIETPGSTRGAKATFPERSNLIATAASVDIIDADTQKLWMRFSQHADGYMIGVDTANDPSATQGLNGKVYVSENGASATGLYTLDFIHDSGFRNDATNYSLSNQPIANRNAANSYNVVSSSEIGNLVDVISNDVSAAVICTGNSADGGDERAGNCVTPKTLVAVATDTGATVINETNSTIYSYSDATNDDYNNVAITPGGELYALNETKAQAEKWNDVHADTANELNGTPNKIWDEASTPALTATAPTIQTIPNTLFVTYKTSTIDSSSDTIYVGTNLGTSVIQDYAGTEASGSVKYYTKDYISEEMVGDARGMFPMNYSGLAADTTIPSADVSLKANAMTTDGAATVPTTGISGIRGTAMSFDGGDYICTGTSGTCGNNTNFNLTTSMSAGLWLKRGAVTGANQGMLGYGNVANTGGWNLYFNTTEHVAVVFNQNSSTYSNRTITDTDTWHHVVFTYDGTHVRLYIDGVLDDTETSIDASSESNIFYIGGCLITTLQYFNGTIDEPFVTATALSASQVKHMYEVGYRALQSHGDGLGGGAADTNQQLGSASNVIGAVVPDYNNQYMYVGANHTTDGALSKIQLNSDTNIKTYDVGANVPSGGTTIIDDDITSLGVGYNLETVGSAASGVKSMGVDNYATTTSGNYVSKTYTLPKNIGSAVLWVSPVLDSSDVSNTITVKASNDAGVSYSTCTLVNTNSNPPVPEREYACTFPASDNDLKVKFEFARGSTKTNTYVVQYGITWLGQTGFRIEQADGNNVRLYNYTGETQNLRLDVITGGLGRNAGTVSLAPSAADVDSQSYTNSLWINKTGTGGNLLKLQTAGTDVLTLTTDGILDLSSSSTSTASAMIRNTSTTAATIGLAIKMSASTIDNTTRFINFMDKNGAVIGKIQGNTATTISYTGNGTDMAEYFTKDDPSAIFTPGTVMCQGSNGVLACSSSNSTKIIGIVSDAPVFLGGVEGPNKVILALTGQVPVRISPTSPAIQPGDFLTIADNGLATKSTGTGYIIGKAQKSWSPTSGENSLQITISYIYADPDLTINNEGDVTLHGETVADYQVVTPIGITSKIGAFASATIAKLTAGLTRTEELQVGTISPLASGSAITVNGPMIIKNSELSNNSEPQAPLLEVDGEIMAATISARTAVLQNIQADTITAKNIVADTISANHIMGLDAKLASISGNLSDSELTSITDRIKARLALLAGNIPDATDIPAPPEATSSATGVWGPESDVSTNSATLASADIDFATVNQYLAVIGQAVITDLDVTNYLYATNINSKTGHLALGNNTLLIDENGQVAINGDLTVSGKILADSAELNSLSLGSPSATSSSELGKLLAVYDESGKQVASIDASGSANLAALTTQLITIAAGSDASASASGLLTTSVKSNATAGESVLVSPNTELVVESPYVTSNSLVYLTPTANTAGKILFVKAKQSCESGSELPNNSDPCVHAFTVGIDTPAGSDIPFNWWIIQLK